jgi:hypothetical protein
MRHFKLLGVAVMALFALAITASSASALTLPDVSTALAGAKYPIHLTYTNKTLKSELENTGAEALTGEGFLLLLEITKLTSFGTFDALFEHVTETSSKEKCFSTGDALGTVLTLGTFHVVPLPPESGKTVGTLYEPNEVVITCAELKIHIKGSQLGTLTVPAAEATETVLLQGTLTGSKGKPTKNKYLNDEGKEAGATLLANFGTGFLGAAENVTGTPDPSGSEMFVVTSR